MKPFISVIVPCYNHESFIVDAISSVAAQDVNGIELIFIDDHSTDNSYSIIQSAFESGTISKSKFYSASLMRNEVNIGAHNTLNKGLELSQGEYIAILNSDDQYSSNRFNYLLGLLESSRSDFIFSGVTCIGNNSQPIISPGSSIEHSLHGIDPHLFSVQYLDKNPAITTGNFLFKRHILSTGLKFRSLRYCHDWDFLLSAVLVCSVTCTKEPLYRYRFHEDNSFKSLTHLADLETMSVLSNFVHNLYVLNKIYDLFGSYWNWIHLLETLPNLQRSRLVNSSLCPALMRLALHES